MKKLNLKFPGEVICWTNHDASLFTNSHTIHKQMTWS